MNAVQDGQQVSVAIINYNGRRYLDELLTSLAAQTIRPARTILVDNVADNVSYTRDSFPG
jgi:GT2 family glycosyltransferase